MIKLLLVDDQAMVRKAFALMLSVEPDIELIGQCADGLQAVQACQRLNPDVVLMDVEMPNMDGVEATRRIRSAGTAEVIMLTTFDRDDYLFDALQAGAAGFLLKNAEPDKLLESIRTVAAGDGLLAPEVTRRVIKQAVGATRRHRPNPSLNELSEREREVLTLMAQGLNNHEIAQELFLGEATVKTHVSSCLAKLGVRDRVQAVIAAYEGGMVGQG